MRANSAHHDAKRSTRRRVGRLVCARARIGARHASRPSRRGLLSPCNAKERLKPYREAKTSIDELYTAIAAGGDRALELYRVYRRDGIAFTEFLRTGGIVRSQVPWASRESRGDRCSHAQEFVDFRDRRFDHRIFGSGLVPGARRAGLGACSAVSGAPLPARPSLQRLSAPAIAKRRSQPTRAASSTRMR